MPKRPRTEGPAGVLLVDKPAGMTSHDVVAQVRRERSIRRVGHAGTLDPFATGLLVLLLGRATRLQRFLLGLEKTYVATARLGWTSTTGDPDGELTETGNMPAALELPTGLITQQLPMTSAVHVDGERLYEKAHRGETVETPSREVFIHRAELLSADGSEATFEVECSSGTYVRTLIETLDDAYCSALRRTAIGPLMLSDAGSDPIEPAEALAFMPEHALSDAELTDISHGRRVAEDPERSQSDTVNPLDPEPTALRLTHQGRLIAIGRLLEGEIRPEVVLEPAGAAA